MVAVLNQPSCVGTDPASDGAWNIGAVMTRGALHEVCCHGKPGLVCRDTPGAHDDMDLHTFMAAIPMLSGPFILSARLGLEHRNGPRSLFAELRSRGAQWETRLMAATGGVNTHRGMLFVGCMVCAAAGAVCRDGHPEADAVCAHLGAMCRGLCASELGRAAAASADGLRLTAGERLYVEHGYTGIRGEVEAGLPCVVRHGLPALRVAVEHGLNLEQCLLHTLVALMAVVEDTTVANRAGVDSLFWLRKRARAIRAGGGVLTHAGREGLEALRAECLGRRISPGGSADLLAVTVALHLLERGRLPEHM